MAVARALVPKYGQAAVDASAGITLTTPTRPVVTGVVHEFDGGVMRVTLTLAGFSFNIASDAALAVGQKVYTLPSNCFVKPLGGIVKITSTCATGLSATAGEVGLGTTIGSGAVATLGGTAAFENVMEGQTIANHVAATALAIQEAANPAPQTASGNGILDATAADLDVHLNIASTWNQTAAEDVTVTAGGLVVFEYRTFPEL